jgi:hypothetical protein
LWLPALNPVGLSQGDILRDIPLGGTLVPLTFLSKEPFTTEQQRVVYTKYDQLQPYPQEQDVGHWVAKGRVSFAVVVTHSCDLDDIEDTERIVVAPVFKISRVTSSEADRARIMNGGRATYAPLPNVPNLGDCYAELRSMYCVDRSLFTAEHRLCSMTDEAVWIFRAQLIDYFTRLEQKHVLAAMQAQMFEEEEAKKQAQDGQGAQD